MKKESKVFELNKKRPEINLLKELSADLSNFKNGFNANLKYTFILGPWSSSMFGLEIENKKIYLGVPEHLFQYMSKNNIYLINYIKGKPGIFLILYSGHEVNEGRPIALRIFMREKRVEALSKFKKITLLKMRSDGYADPGYMEAEFEVRIKEVSGLDWESFGKKKRKNNS